MSDMRAVVISGPGGPEVLEVRNVPLPEPGAGQVRVRVAATAVNRADILQRQGRYPAPAGAPADVPGLEYAGTVESIGPDVTAWRVGDRVMGLVGGGAYAEAVVVHEREAVPVPSGMSLEEAASLPEAFVTAYDALFGILGLAPGERVLIHAVGSGVGTAALQLATVAGAVPYGTSRSAGKLERAAMFGLASERAIDTSSGDWAEQLLERAGRAGVDAVLDLVGGSYLPGNLKALRERGRLVVVGLVAGRSAELDMGLLLRRRITITGTVLRSRPLEEKIAAAQQLRRHVLPLVEAGKVRPVIERVLPMGDVAEAHRIVESDLNFGKVVLRW